MMLKCSLEGNNHKCDSPLALILSKQTRQIEVTWPLAYAHWVDGDNPDTPDMVIIWPHMACLPIFLSHTTYTSHIPPHMGSNGRQIAVNRGFSCKNLPCSRLQKIITRPFFDLEPCPIHQNDHIVHPYNLYNSDLPKFTIFLLKITNKWRNQPQNQWKKADFSTYL